MKSLRYLIVTLAAILTIASPALAADLRGQDEKVLIGKDEIVLDDLYAASGEVDLSGNVEGDTFVAGGMISVTGTVSQDLFVAGGDITIDGAVGDDLRVTGGTIRINGRIGGDLLVAGGQVTIGPNAEIDGVILAGSGQLVIEGTTHSVRAGVGTLTVRSTANIQGDLRYSSDEAASIASGAVITGQTVRETPVEVAKNMQYDTSDMLFGLLMAILLALLYMYVFPNKTVTLATNWRTQFGKNILWGFLSLIALPILAILLMVTIVGIPVGIGIFLTFPILLFMGHLIGVIAFGTWLMNLWAKHAEPKPDWLAVVLGAVVLGLLKLVPFIGAVIMCIVFLAGVGTLVQSSTNLYKKLRHDKTW